MLDVFQRFRMSTYLFTAMLMLLAGQIPAEDVADSHNDFNERRSAYRLDLTSGGTRVIHRATQTERVVPYGETMLFADYERTSKNTQWTIRNVASHAEAYVLWEESSEWPVDFLRTAMYSTWGGLTPIECIERIDQCPHSFPDTSDKVVVAYINLMEFTNIGQWDFAFEPRWDANGDAVIDRDVVELPEYVDTRVFNEPWKNYVAAYWTEAWKRVLERKIDLAVQQNFDGLMFDVMTGYWTWVDVYPEMKIDDLRRKSVDLLRAVSDYTKDTYGDSVVVTANLDLDTYSYFDDLGEVVDGGYYQNAYFRWDGSGNVDGLGLSESESEYANARVDFLREQNLVPLSMEHLGTGNMSEGLEFEDFDARITEDRLLGVFRWAIDSGMLPFVAPVAMKSIPFESMPRFCRVIPENANLAVTGYSDWVIGSDRDDRISTGAGNDLLYGGIGNDQLFGGDGFDRALYDLSSSEYDVDIEKGMVTVTERSSRRHVDTLTQIEQLVFADKSIDLRE